MPAQVPPEDSAALAAADSAEQRRRLADTIKAPLPRPPMPAPLGIGPRYSWDREQLAATGALSMLELLEGIPGITTFRTGWIATPQLAAYVGDAGGVRLFLDNIELSPLSPRTESALDLAEIPIWPLDEVVVERGVAEIRVYMRTWTVERTTPYTRTDVYTGDEDTNIYRGWFGRRFSHGEALQLAGEQYGTAGRRFGAGDQLALLGRVGIGRARWAADAFVIRANRTRQSQTPFLGGTAIPPLTARRTTAYVRASAGDPSAGAWLQLVAASQAYKEHSPQGSGVPTDGADTTRSLAEYIASASMSWNRARILAEGRARVGDGETRFSQNARLTTSLGPLAAQIFAEHAPADSVIRVDATVESRLFGPFFASVSGGLVNDDRESAARSRSAFARAEIGLATRRAWLAAGAIYRDSTVLAPAELFELGFMGVEEEPALGGYLSMRGKLWRDIGVDLSFVGWEAGGWYRPQYHLIGRLFLQSNWLSRFPSGNFGVLASGQLEFRDGVVFPTAAGALETQRATVLSTLLEIRIVDAVLTWQVRNAFQLSTGNTQRYAQIPGFVLPPAVNLYGVRWYFWN